MREIRTHLREETMFIERELEGGESQAEVQNDEGTSRLTRKLLSILATCETLEQEIEGKKGRGLVPEEMDDLSKRVSEVRTLAESMLDGAG